MNIFAWKTSPVNHILTPKARHNWFLASRGYRPNRFSAYREKKCFPSSFFINWHYKNIFNLFFFVLPTDPRKSASRRSEKPKINYVWPYLLWYRVVVIKDWKFHRFCGISSLFRIEQRHKQDCTSEILYADTSFK